MSASTTFAATENVRSKGDMTVLTLCLPHSLGSQCPSPKLQILEVSVRLRPILRLPQKEGGSPTTKTALCCATSLVPPGLVSEVTSRCSPSERPCKSTCPSEVPHGMAGPSSNCIKTRPKSAKWSKNLQLFFQEATRVPSQVLCSKKQDASGVDLDKPCTHTLTLVRSCSHLLTHLCKLIFLHINKILLDRLLHLASTRMEFGQSALDSMKANLG
jgi:hypothetical protein